MASIDILLKTITAVSADTSLGDPLLAELALKAERRDEVPIPVVLNLLDGSSVSGVVSSGKAMAVACDRPLERFWDNVRLLPDAPPDAVAIYEKWRPILGGRSVAQWHASLHESYAEALERAQPARETNSWSDVDDADLLTILSLRTRAAITLRDVTVERDGSTRLVPLLRVTLATVTSWWVVEQGDSVQPRS